MGSEMCIRDRPRDVAQQGDHNTVSNFRPGSDWQRDVDYTEEPRCNKQCNPKEDAKDDSNDLSSAVFGLRFEHAALALAGGGTGVRLCRSLFDPATHLFGNPPLPRNEGAVRPRRARIAGIDWVVSWVVSWVV